MYSCFMRRFQIRVAVMLLAVWNVIVNSYTNEGNETKVYAIYFPQFHEDKMNSKLWGKGFTDWDRVKVHAGKVNRYGNRIPQPTDLGYYDIARKEVRAKQAVLAKQYGVDGFLYYHYWFGAPGLGPVLSTPLERMLEDGEPDLPFAFIYANENWSANWHGASKADGGLLLAMNYTSRYDPNTIAHYGFLRRFFHHKNYIKINGAPLFLPYKITATQFEPRPVPELIRYLGYLNELAIADGFPGINMPHPAIFSEHELYTKYPLSKRKYPDNIAESVAYMAFPVTLPKRQVDIPERCILKIPNAKEKPQYLGLTTTFDYTIRRAWDKAYIWLREFSKYNVTGSFEMDLVRTLYFEQCCQEPATRDQGGRFMMVNAWNEWGEAMVLEPSDVYGYDFLEAIPRSKEAVRKFGCNYEKLQDYETAMDRRSYKPRSNFGVLLRAGLEDVKASAWRSQRTPNDLKNKIMDLDVFITDVILPQLELRLNASKYGEVPAEPPVLQEPVGTVSGLPGVSTDLYYLLLSGILVVVALIMFCRASRNSATPITRKVRN